MFISTFALPPFAFVESSEHDRANFRAGRIILIHSGTLTLMEVFDLSNILIMELPTDAFYLDFNFFTATGSREEYRIVIQATIYNENQDILLEAAKWYTEYLTWYESNISI